MRKKGGPRNSLAHRINSYEQRADKRRNTRCNQEDKEERRRKRGGGAAKASVETSKRKKQEEVAGAKTTGLLVQQHSPVCVYVCVCDGSTAPTLKKGTRNVFVWTKGEDPRDPGGAAETPQKAVVGMKRRAKGETMGWEKRQSSSNKERQGVKPDMADKLLKFTSVTSPGQPWPPPSFLPSCPLPSSPAQAYAASLQ